MRSDARRLLVTQDGPDYDTACVPLLILQNYRGTGLEGCVRLQKLDADDLACRAELCIRLRDIGNNDRQVRLRAAIKYNRRLFAAFNDNARWIDDQECHLLMAGIEDQAQLSIETVDASQLTPDLQIRCCTISLRLRLL